MTIQRTILTVFSFIAILCVLISAGPAAPQVSLAGVLATPNRPGAAGFVYLPIVTTPALSAAGNDWTQHAHDAQHTGYTSQVVSAPWHWKWSWNGPNAQGAIAAGKISLPRNVQPVTGGGRVYVAAGANGIFALDTSNGSPLWNHNPGGSINSTPAYDSASDSLFAVSSDGHLYRLNAATGLTTGNFNGQATSTLPLPPAVFGGRVFFSMGAHVFAVQMDTMGQIWSYDAGSIVETPPAFSPATGLVVADSADLYIHAIHDSNGTRAWRVKPTSLSPGDPGDNNPNALVSYGWPVIADVHGLVLVKLRLNWQTLWTWNPWPATNAEMRANLAGRPDQHTLYALRLSDGGVAFNTNVGNGGFGDGGRLDMGPQPVVKRFADGSEVAYAVIRGSTCINLPCDGRYDSHFGELELDSTTVSGFQAGDVRFMQNTFFPTDEQPSLSMSGDFIFGGHWMFGIALQILDRSAGRGASSATPITTSNLPHFVTSASNCTFSSSHYCSNGLLQDGDPRSLPAGFYIYFNQGTVYNQYWRGYSAWIVSGNLVYFLSNDGALIVLESGPIVQTPAGAQPPVQGAAPAPVLDRPIDYTRAGAYAGSVADVDGEIKYEFNNGKYVLLGFKVPHQDAFAVLIPKDAWANFSSGPDRLFAVGQSVRVHGLIEWYQGDPVIYIRQPGEIQVVTGSQ